MKAIRLSLFCLIALITGCNQEEPLHHSDLTVQEVKNHFNQHLTGARTSGISIPEVLWEHFEYREISIGDALLFPLEFQENIYISNSLDSTKVRAERAVYAFAYKLDDEIQFEIIRLVGSAPGQAFTGFVFVEDWAGSTKRIFEFDENRFVGELDLNESNTRAEEMVCTTTTIVYWTCVETPYSIHCTNVGGSTTKTCQEYKSLSGDESSGGGGDYDPWGGGSGSDPVGCPPDYVEGENGNCIKYVEECAPGEVRDEAGDCVPISSCFGSPCCDENNQLIEDCLNDIPCPGDPVKNMQITSPGSSGLNGGRVGCFRGCGSSLRCCTDDTTKKFHDGIDISANQGTYVFTAFSGKVVEVLNTFDVSEYRVNSYGNYVVVESTQADGTLFRIKYNHLDYVNVSVGHTLGVGMLIGRTGTTGNASSLTTKVTSHVHIQAKIKSGKKWVRSNPENFLATKWDEDGNIESTPCTN